MPEKPGFAPVEPVIDERDGALDVSTEDIGGVLVPKAETDSERRARIALASVEELVLKNSDDLGEVVLDEQEK